MRDIEVRRRLTDWFRQWRSPLHKFLIRKAAVSAADLEDISQEVFLRLLRFEQLELVEHPRAYLFKMASHVAAEWSIRAHSRHPHESEWLASLLIEDSPEDSALRESTQHEIERAINTLSARQREVLKLQFSEGLGHAEIARRIGSTPRSVKRCITKSYQKLRVELKPELLGAQRSGGMRHGRA